jgi:hypothetical protein
MGEYREDGDLVADIKELQQRISALANSQGRSLYLVADRPAPSTRTGLIIFVPDAAAGSKFQGSDGTSWVSLG